MCVCMSLALQGKNKLFVWLPREYVHLADPLRIKGTGSRGSWDCFWRLSLSAENTTYSMCLSLVFASFFSLPEVGIISKEKESQSRVTVALTAEVHVYRESHASKLCRCRGNHYQTCHSQALNISSTGVERSSRIEWDCTIGTVLYCMFADSILPPVEGFYCTRPIQCLASSEILTPHPLTARRVCILRLWCWGRTHSLGAEWVGGQ